MFRTEKRVGGKGLFALPLPVNSFYIRSSDSNCRIFYKTKLTKFKKHYFIVNSVNYL